MPETIRVQDNSIRSTSRLRRSLGRRLSRRIGSCSASHSLIIAIAFFTALGPAAAQRIIRAPGDDGPPVPIASLDLQEVAALAVLFGVIFFAVVTAITLVRTRTRAAAADDAARAEIVGLKAQTDRLNTLLLGDPQVLIAWTAGGEGAEVIGSASSVTESNDPADILAFESWLDAEKAKVLHHAAEALRADGIPFAFALVTRGGRHVEAEGRAIGGRAVLRLREVTGLKRELLESSARNQELERAVEALRVLTNALPTPIWTRDAHHRLVFANPAYARSVEAREAADAVDRGVELFDREERARMSRAAETGEPFHGRLPAIIVGERRILDVAELPTPHGRVGIGIDATEVEALRSETARMVEAHRRTLDQLATGVAIFGPDKRLMFYNASYLRLWGFDAGFLDQNPTDSAILDRLRTTHRLPEQQDFRKWKNELHEAYCTTEPREQEWHLPDRRTLRVVTTPNPEGGVTYLFDDVTERLELARQYDSLIRVQGETLDNLAEALAVFGSDGRLRLHNPAFQRMWRLAPEVLADRPHIESLIALCRPLHRDEATWAGLRAAVTGLDERKPLRQRIERNDGAVLDCATVPLPDGGTLVACQDVTDSVNVERALREKNEALETADRLKLDFVHHVSYELRSPLTNIIGFAHFLGDPATGPLTNKQHEYLSYITVSTNALLAIINNILDLATIDAGAMTLSLGEVDIRDAMNAAAEGIQDRLVRDDLSLDMRVNADIGQFSADERRLRQVLFNLLSNAVGFSPKGGAIFFTADRRPDAIVFSVTDRGPGIPPDIKDKVFDLFETNALGSRHRGAGLGLSIVRSFVELHGGKVSIDSAVGRGTTVTCTFPLEQAAKRPAAE